MKYIEQVTMKPSEARSLEYLGFRLHLIAMHSDGTDTYDVYALEQAT